MFDDLIRASFAAQGKAMAEHANEAAAGDYVLACQNWAANRGAGAKPEASLAIEAVIAFEPEFSLTFRDTGVPVSSVKPESFLPVYATDKDALGGRVGGPILGQPGKFYLQSGSRAMHGETETVGANQFEFRAPFFGLGGYWVAR